MYSDDWIKLRNAKSEQIEVSDIVFYRIRTDHAGAEVGVTVDFETSNDLHYEMPLSEWQRFLDEVLRINESNDITAALRDYFVKNEELFVFERDLRIHGIRYQKIFF